MPTPGHNRNLRPTILDRLIDDHPDSTTESITNHFTTVAQLKQTVTRDLEALLNTRQETLEPLHQAFCELQHSLMTYGLPDFTTSNLQNAQDHNAIRRALEQAITTFEPRLDRVRVILEPPRQHDHTLQFRIDAVLRLDPAPEPVSFDATLLNAQKYVVQGSD